MFSMSHFGVGYLHPTKEPQHDLPSLPPPKGEMASSFSWTSLFKSPTRRPLCLGDPILAKLNQVIPVPKDTLNKYFITELLSMCETEYCAIKSIPFSDPGVHTGTTVLLKPKASITMPVEERGKGATIVTLKKKVHVVNYVVNYGVDKSTYLTNQELYDMVGTSCFNILVNLDTTSTLITNITPQGC